MLPVLIASAVGVKLPEVGPVGLPIGQPVVQLKCLVAAEEKDKGIEAGVWEASPGSWRRTIVKAELSHFIAGRCTFTPDGGAPMEITAGDAVYFPANSFGVWNVYETVRKTYVMFGK